MTLEIFFEKFHLFADAPDAVPRMRALVLELAVRGQLSERKIEDGDDPAWCTFLAEFDNRIYGSDPGPPHPFEVPEEWRWVCIEDVADPCGQKKPDELFTYIDVASVDNERGAIKSELDVLTPDRAPSRARKMVKRGTVIYATVRPYLKNIAVIDRDFTPPAIVSTAFAILHPRSFADGRFLFHWLRSRSFEAEVAKRMKGVAYPAINDGEFRGCPIPLPPLAEQKRIVAKVDELMALCDQLEAQQQELETRHAALVRASLARFAEAPTSANLDFLFHQSYAITPTALRKAILTLAVQGKLVPQDPHDEPAEEWLKGFSESKENEANETGEPPLALPPQWIWLRVASVFEVAGGIQKTPQRVPRNNAFPYLGVGNVYRGRLDLTNVKKFELETGELERRRLETGDLLIIEGNGSFNEIGRCAKWNEEIKDCVHQNHVIRCRPCDRRISDFVLLFLNSPNGTEIMQRLAITSSGLFSLSVGKIRQIEIPLPPLAEQRRIVAKVDELMALVDALETQLAAARAAAEKLLAAAVAELTSSTAPARGETEPLAAEDSTPYGGLLPQPAAST